MEELLVQPVFTKDALGAVADAAEMTGGDAAATEAVGAVVGGAARDNVKVRMVEPQGDPIVKSDTRGKKGRKRASIPDLIKRAMRHSKYEVR